LENKFAILGHSRSIRIILGDYSRNILSGRLSFSLSLSLSWGLRSYRLQVKLFIQKLY